MLELHHVGLRRYAVPLSLGTLGDKPPGSLKPSGDKGDKGSTKPRDAWFAQLNPCCACECPLYGDTGFREHLVLCCLKPVIAPSGEFIHATLLSYTVRSRDSSLLGDLAYSAEFKCQALGLRGGDLSGPFSIGDLALVRVSYAFTRDSLVAASGFTIYRCYPHGIASVGRR